MLGPCKSCAGTGSRVLRGEDGWPVAFQTCRACKGDGTQVRADLELLADALASPGGSDA